MIFVYGTLRSDSSANAHGLLGGAELVAGASFRGRLYLVGAYPGVVPSRDPDDRVQGQVFRLHDAGRILARLDVYEGALPQDPCREYQRERREVRLSNGETVRAWIYLYTRPTRALRRITSGDFLAAESAPCSNGS